MGLAAGLLAGCALGAFFFGGLWWTVRKGVGAQHVARWFVCSMLLRTSVVVLGFYYILGNDWKRLLAGLVGFVIARLIVIRLTRTAANANPFAQDASHAP